MERRLQGERAGPRSALLRGRDHQRYGAVATASEGAAAVALSIGGARKTYGHVDPNEDAALFALGDGGALLAVADGHDGAAGAEAALAWLRDARAPAWTAASGEGLPGPDAWTEAAVQALAGANEAVLRARPAPGAPASRSTLALLLVRFDEPCLRYVSIGDSHVFLVDAAGARDEAWHPEADGPPRFLGFEPESPGSLRGSCRAGTAPRAGLRAALLATDGLSEYGIGVRDPAAAVQAAVDAAAAHAPDLRAREASRGVAEAALAAQKRQRAGDNVAVATLWLD